MPGPQSPPTISPLSFTYTTMLKQQAQGQWRAGLSSSRKRHERKANFRLRASVNIAANGQPSLLARRAATNAAAITSYPASTLFPSISNTIDLTSPEVIDLVTPPNATAIDSGYVSGPTSAPPSAKRSASIDLPELSSAAKSSVTAHGYTSTMHQLHDAQFYKKVVAKEFRHNPKQAREDLKPIMRQMLEKPEDRPMVSKFYLQCNFRRGTIRGEKRLVRRPPRKSGERVIMGGSSEQMTEYFGEKLGYA